MKTMNIEQSEAQIGELQQEPTWLDTMGKRLWRFRHGLELQFESDNVKSWTLKGTPYSIVKENGVYFSVIGQNRVSDTFKKIEECIKDAKRLDVYKVMQIAIMISDEAKRRATKTTK